MSRIGPTFTALKAQNKKALIPFITAGDPGRGMTVPLMHALVEAGADIIELGVPFSDPMADGPVIQRASERALANKVGLRDVLQMTLEFRKVNTTTPVVLMGYANPVERMGYAAFAEAAKAAGVDGVLTVDIPPEEAAGVADVFKAAGLDPIFLLSPTTPEARVAQVAAAAGGFIYYVSLKGVTGSANLDTDEVAKKLAMVRSHCALPVGVGFGIRDAATAEAVARIADAVVVGSRIVNEIETAPESELVERVKTLVRDLRRGVDAASK
ncbi:MAG: tryptophan synthase subunit alpha [Hydrogenophilales bacterium 16-64-46]|nr:MAG: tryptophan synthase subunit alpha [Hydrogenophilales bacterium 12-64-13]OYZ05527.1 MAG: tryptophan synthase subunit alpha [Hydrogenophilales bacterium 16-64-46]OZA40107.1 MAG: tryptophan synthase subunit alpha [Hydrogenophilales bacterium 17-64-34]HQT00373.1 tryptophan synthase subunit alpha [Thiobacillus sp.]